MSKISKLILQAEQLKQAFSGNDNSLSEQERQAVHDLLELYEIDATGAYPEEQYDKFEEFYIKKEQECFDILVKRFGTDEATTAVRVFKTMMYSLNDDYAVDYPEDETLWEIGII